MCNTYLTHELYGHMTFCNFFWHSVIRSSFDGANSVSNKFTEHGLCNDVYYFIRWRPAELVKIAFPCYLMTRIYNLGNNLIK